MGILNDIFHDHVELEHRAHDLVRACDELPASGPLSEVARRFLVGVTGRRPGGAHGAHRRRREAPLPDVRKVLGEEPEIADLLIEHKALRAQIDELASQLADESHPFDTADARARAKSFNHALDEHGLREATYLSRTRDMLFPGEISPG